MKQESTLAPEPAVTATETALRLESPDGMLKAQVSPEPPSTFTKKAKDDSISLSASSATEDLAQLDVEIEKLSKKMNDHATASNEAKTARIAITDESYTKPGTLTIAKSNLKHIQATKSNEDEINSAKDKIAKLEADVAAYYTKERTETNERKNTSKLLRDMKDTHKSLLKKINNGGNGKRTKRRKSKRRKTKRRKTKRSK